MDVEIAVPFIFFGTIVAVVWLIFYFSSKKRESAHKTIRLAIEKGQDISPELIENMSDMVNPRRRDMRKSVILLTLAIAMCAIAFIVPIDSDNGIRGVLAGAVIPGALGLAYLGLWRFGHDRSAV